MIKIEKEPLVLDEYGSLNLASLLSPGFHSWSAEKGKEGRLSKKTSLNELSEVIEVDQSLRNEEIEGFWQL